MKTKIVMMVALIGLASFFLSYFTSCSTAKQYTAFDVTYNLPKVNFNYPVSILKSGEVILYSGQININLDSILMAHDIPSGMITSLQFSQFAITITDPPEASFGWLQSARAVASSEASFDPNVELGNAVNNDTTAKTVNLTMNNVELQQYIHKTSFYYKVLGTLNGPLPYEMVSMYLNSTLKLHIEPL
jgi:hypothetical protein